MECRGLLNDSLFGPGERTVGGRLPRPILLSPLILSPRPRKYGWITFGKLIFTLLPLTDPQTVVTTGCRVPFPTTGMEVDKEGTGITVELQRHNSTGAPMEIDRARLVRLAGTFWQGERLLWQHLREPRLMGTHHDGFCCRGRGRSGRLVPQEGNKKTLLLVETGRRRWLGKRAQHKGEVEVRNLLSPLGGEPAAGVQAPTRTQSGRRQGGGERGGRPCSRLPHPGDADSRTVAPSSGEQTGETNPLPACDCS